MIDPNVTGIEGMEDAKEALADLRASVPLQCRCLVPDLMARIQDGDCVTRRPGESDDSFMARVIARIKEAGPKQ